MLIHSTNLRPNLIPAVLLLLCALALLAACSNRTPVGTSEKGSALRHVTDEAGTTITVPSKIKRFISLAPNLTEIAYAIGAGDRLVGNTTYCDYPDEAKNVQKVGDTLQPSIERILALRPQLVLISTASQLEAFTKQLNEHKISVYVTDPRDLEGVFRSITNLGKLLNQQERADEVVATLRARVTAVESAVKTGKPVRVFFQLLSEPLYTAGRESFVTDLIRRAGGARDTGSPTHFRFLWQDQIILLDGSLQISLGARQQVYRIRAADRPGFLNEVKASNSITGDGAVAYFIRSTGTKLRAHVGNGFRAASLFERFGNGEFQNTLTRFGDPTLRAEQSIAVDVGFDQRAANNKLLFGMTYFYTRLQRVIDFKSFRSIFTPTGDPDPLGLGRSGGFLNFPGGMSRGVESFVEAAPYRGTSIRASYTFTNADRLALSGGLQPQFVTPKHLFGLSMLQRYRKVLLSFDLNRTGQYIATVFPANLTFPAFTKADLFLSYERSLSDGVAITLFGGADNILNRTYFENGFRAPGAVGRGGINFKF